MVASENDQVTHLFESYLHKRDYSAALVLLEEHHVNMGQCVGSNVNHGDRDRFNWMWKAYLYFHLGEYTKAQDIYMKLRARAAAYAGKNKVNEALMSECALYLACVYFKMQMWDEAEEMAKQWSPYRTMACWYLWRILDPIPVEY